MTLWNHLIIFYPFVVPGVHLATTLIKRDEGYYITGKGCGLTKPMKYLQEIPQNLDDHQCSFIPPKDKVSFFCDGCESGECKIYKYIFLFLAR